MTAAGDSLFVSKRTAIDPLLNWYNRMVPGAFGTGTPYEILYEFNGLT
jgi:hypothetical protein